MIRLHIPEANLAWSLILQSGVRVACTVGIPLRLLLRQELELTEDQLRPVDVLILDGMPVDDQEKTIVSDRARLALAAGLPGIAGLAMKQGSAVRALRSGITHTPGGEATPCSGTICLSLYSLVLPLLAGHFLRRGFVVEVAQILRYARFAPENRCLIDNTPATHCGDGQSPPCSVSQSAGTPMIAADLARILADVPQVTPVLLTADILDVT
ncbi:MAG: hypothetical protein LBI88_04555 [Deltaproteobacteria bacterium]|jgi:hypothetical protein|nr:hypothetical protein [Deltaproteobacteria bacterium]